MAEMLQRRGPFEALSSSLSSLQLVILEINRGLDPFESLDTRRPPGLLMANGKVSIEIFFDDHFRIINCRVELYKFLVYTD